MMSNEKTNLHKRIESGGSIVMAEVIPPQSLGVEQIRALAKRFDGRVHALGVSDNHDQIHMSVLAMSSLILAEGVEPVMHMVTRDRNRVALTSDGLGARALGVRNILCTSGTHQSLLPFEDAKSVFDIDATLLIQSFRDLDTTAADGTQAPLCLGAVASPYADPLELQLRRLEQKVSVGAQFMITHPVFDLDRFFRWWNEVTARGLHKHAAFLAGIKILTDAEAAKAYREKRPSPMVPDEVVNRLESKDNKRACRAEGIKIALETIEKLSAADGLRGFEVVCDDDTEASLEVLESLKKKLG
jgi:methylenetetrahydrofolate reductase (NADPH)